MAEPTTVLYIDDSVGDRILLDRALKLAHSTVRLLAISPEDGDQRNGSKSFEELVVAPALLYQPGVILLDLNMPRTSGEEILAQIKRDKRIRHIPVIAFSAEDNLARALHLRNLGAAEYLLKPAGLDELAAAVIGAVERHTS